jgi:hypothetical protein
MQASYFWFSRERANESVGNKVTGRDGVERIDKGFAIVLDLEYSNLFQYEHSTDDPKPAGKPGVDTQLVAVIEDPKKACVALNGFGEITPAGEQYCQQHGLPATPESLISRVKDFYQPQESAGHVPEVVDLRQPARPSSPLPKP